MATKKQKRERGEARYKERLADSIASGLKAQAEDRKFRQERALTLARQQESGKKKTRKESKKAPKEITIDVS